MCNLFKKNTKVVQQHIAFTLAEVLITLGIIGVVAAMSIPILIKLSQEYEYRVSYKKAYSDISQAFAKAIVEYELLPRTSGSEYPSTASEWNVLKNAFKVSKACNSTELYACWVDADRVCVGACGACGGAGVPAVSYSGEAFVDSSGRAWAQYAMGFNIFVVDTNGSKKPNQFGKDRWMFSLQNSDGIRTTSGYPIKVGLHVKSDQTVSNEWCQHPPCNYESWLFD